MEIYSIGFTQSTAAHFFGRLTEAKIKRLLDTRLHNSSQLAGFAKRDDLAYFLKEIRAADYVHEPLLAPTQELLNTYRKQKGSWLDYEHHFLSLLSHRRIENYLDKRQFEVPTVLLCSEPTAEHCHRRLVLEYLQDKWHDLEIIHL